MTRLEKKLKATLRALGVAADARLVAAVSGGADSTALLDALARLHKGAIVVAHLNHQLRGAESDEDEAFVGRLAEARGLAFVSEQRAVGELAKAQGRNLEAVAREVRYQFLYETARAHASAFVLTAHTHDDQAETILMRLVRGTGAAGLRAIHAERPLGQNVRALRPLLGVTRAEVLEHCAGSNLQYRTDGSNLAGDLTRNRVRRELLPLLREFNPQADRSFVQLAARLAGDEDFLQQMADDSLNACRDGRALRLTEVNALAPALRPRVLRAWLQAERGDLGRIDAVHIEALENLMQRGRSGKRVLLPEGASIWLEFGRLRLVAGGAADTGQTASVALLSGIEQDFGGFRFKLMRRAGRETSGDCAWLKETADLDALRLRVRARGDAYIPADHLHATKLKTLMIRHKIPASQRDSYPVVVTGNNRIVWSPGLPVAREFVADPEASEQALITVYRLCDI